MSLRLMAFATRRIHAVGFRGIELWFCEIKLAGDSKGLMVSPLPGIANLNEGPIRITSFRNESLIAAYFDH